MEYNPLGIWRGILSSQAMSVSNDREWRIASLAPEVGTHCRNSGVMYFCASSKAKILGSNL